MARKRCSINGCKKVAFSKGKCRHHICRCNRINKSIWFNGCMIHKK